MPRLSLQAAGLAAQAPPSAAPAVSASQPGVPARALLSSVLRPYAIALVATGLCKALHQTSLNPWRNSSIW